MNARDYAFKVWKPLGHLAEPKLILLVLHKFFDGIETKESKTAPLIL
jgi:hypothetical protein